MEILPERTGFSARPGHDNDELEWGKQHIPDEPHVLFADRVTELHDIPLAPGLEKLRKRTHRRKVGRLSREESGDEET